MILVKSHEQAVRMVEAMNAWSAVLPIYDTEMRAAFKSIANRDLAQLIPAVFMDVGRICAENQESMNEHLDYIEQLIQYVRGRTDELPTIEMDVDVAQWKASCRERAERLVKSWRVKEGKTGGASAID